MNKNCKIYIAGHKGLVGSAISRKLKKEGYNNVLEMYKDLFRSKLIKFDLTNDKTKHNFKFNKDYTIKTLDVFTREIQF